MNSRERILSRILNNQPGKIELPEIKITAPDPSGLREKFGAMLVNIGGAIQEVNSWEDIIAFITEKFSDKRVVSTIPELTQKFGVPDFKQAPQLLSDVHLAVLAGQFAVAENGAIWITDDAMGDRALPFITEHLALVVRAENILSTLHEAYDRIGSADYQLGTFIAGPSKTADIEQSLVLGAHGAKSLTVFLKKN